MILYRDKSRAGIAPPGLDGVADLHRRQDPAGDIWGVGDGILVGPQPERSWQDMDAPWQCCQVGAFDPQTAIRMLAWAPTKHANDTAGRSWDVPAILDESGHYRIIHPIGPNWEPCPTPDQAKARNIAEWFRAQLEAAESGLTPGLPMAEAAQGVAFLLSLTHGVCIDAMRVLCLLDEALILAVALKSSGYKE
jgi:hypothetical protein